MTRIYIMVEGQTEEAFLNEVMVGLYATRGIYITPIIVSTSPGYKGGVTSYSKVKPQIDKLCKQDAGAFITTFFDFYALPKDFPGQSGISPSASALVKVLHLEQHLAAAIGHTNFIPNIVLHEFEALLLTDIDAFAEWTDDDDVLEPLRKIRLALAPEDINGSVHTAPSKRIIAAMPGYQKTFHGPLIASTIGLDAIRAACPHFHRWLIKLEALNPS